jgi:hypothetical protein
VCVYSFLSSSLFFFFFSWLAAAARRRPCFFLYLVVSFFSFSLSLVRISIHPTLDSTTGENDSDDDEDDDDAFYDHFILSLFLLLSVCAVQSAKRIEERGKEKG